MDRVRSFQTGAEDISPDCEPLILVDEVDREVGHLYSNGGASGAITARLCSQCLGVESWAFL